MNDAARRIRASAELIDVLATLDELTDLVAEGKGRFYSSADRRARLRYLWIVVGSRLKNHCAIMNIPRAAGEAGQAISFRQVLAYKRADSVDDDVVWHTSFHDLPMLRGVVRETLGDLAHRAPDTR